MLTIKDLENAVKKNYVDFSDAVKTALTEKLNNNPIIKSKMSEIDQYDAICEKCDEMTDEEDSEDDEDEEDSEDEEDD